MLEPAGGLWRAGVDRSAGLRRAWRLYGFRLCDPCRLEPAFCDPDCRRRRRPFVDSHGLRRLPSAGRVFRHWHLGRGGSIPPDFCAMDSAWRWNRDIAALAGGEVHGRRWLGEGGVRRQILRRAGYRQLLDRAGSCRRGHRRDLLVSAHPKRACSVGHPRQSAGGGKRWRQYDPGEIRGLCLRRRRRCDGRGADLFPEGVDHAVQRLQRRRLDGVCAFHRGDRRHRHARGTDHRRADLLLLAKLAVRLRNLVPDGAWRHRYRRHAGGAARNMGLGAGAIRLFDFPHSAAVDRTGYAGARLHPACPRNESARAKGRQRGRDPPRGDHHVRYRNRCVDRGLRPCGRRLRRLAVCLRRRQYHDREIRLAGQHAARPHHQPAHNGDFAGAWRRR